MKKVLFFAMALVAGVLAFTSCDPNNPSNPTGDGNKYEGVWVSDSVIDANGDQYPHGAFWTILNSKEVEIHGWGTSCTWEEKDLVFTFHVGQEGFKIVMQADQDIADEHMALHVTEGAPYLNVPEGATLYMYRLPQPQGKKLPVTEANLLGEWRTTYEINAMYDANGQKDGETKFYHSWQIWNFQANGVASSYSDPYTYNGWWVLDGEKLAFSTGTKPETMKADYFYNVELYSNYMHLISYTYREDGVTLSGSNEKFLYRVK
ncbi:MAG: hypothetical protein IKG86_01145 [Paludibacteraceae bacterium]|nr:hypothetical protein [Paludibacteraceae bacterium]